jgi:hypothetical protein
MNRVQRNLKTDLSKGGLITPSSLKSRCRARGKSIAGLAREIGRSRWAVYCAIENPRRYSLTYHLIQQALSA